MLQIAYNNKFRLGPGKTHCCVMKIEAVGYEITATGIVPLPRNCTKALILDVQRLKDWKYVRCWMGMLNFINGYIPKLAITTKKLKLLIFDEKKMKDIDNLKISSERKRI